jgi:Uma2 family endonuclease
MRRIKVSFRAALGMMARLLPAAVGTQPSPPPANDTSPGELIADLTRERQAAFKSEYYLGQIYAMAGSTPEHNAIPANVAGVAFAALTGKPCQTFSSDMKVRTASLGLFANPDLSIVCGEPQFHDTKRDVLTNPIVIIKVLSDSTETYDRGKKFLQYRQLESLKEYVLIAQDAPYIDCYTPQADATWLLTTVSGLEATLTLASIDCALPLSGIYRNILFPSETLPVETPASG